jgi:hypothetical protein
MFWAAMPCSDVVDYELASKGVVHIVQLGPKLNPLEKFQ